MSECIVCRGKCLGEEPVDKVFNADGRHVPVAGMPATVCQDCGERSFSREATERARLLVHDPPEGASAKSVPMQVYDFACPAGRRTKSPITRGTIGIC